MIWLVLFIAKSCLTLCNFCGLQHQTSYPSLSPRICTNSGPLSDRTNHSIPPTFPSHSLPQSFPGLEIYNEVSSSHRVAKCGVRGIVLWKKGVCASCSLFKWLVFWRTRNNMKYVSNLVTRLRVPIFVSSTRRINIILSFCSLNLKINHC